MIHRGSIALAAAITLAIPTALHAQEGQDRAGDSLPPIGYGTLRQGDVAVRLEAGNVEFRVLPLHEWVIRLLAPDSYQALHQVRESRAADVNREIRSWGESNPSLFLVTAFGLEEATEFAPEALAVISRNRFFRPIAIIPLSSGWGEHRLRRRQGANALYVFAEGIEPREPMTIEYAGRRSTAWSRVIPTLEMERVRVASRAKRPDA